MDTSWIQVFVLTLSECIAPAGKSVCQEQQVQYQFVDREECETALQQLIEYGADSAHVIVNEGRSSCRPMVKEQQVFASLEEANRQSGGEELAALQAQQRPRQDPETEAAHQERLAALPECEDVNRRPPCKVGSIIVESENEDELEVWRRDRN